MIKLLIITISIFLPTLLFTQNPHETLWIRTFSRSSSESRISVLQTTDNGFEIDKIIGFAKITDENTNELVMQYEFEGYREFMMTFVVNNLQMNTWL